jgi:hypothetical protein
MISHGTALQNAANAAVTNPERAEAWVRIAREIREAQPTPNPPAPMLSDVALWVCSAATPVLVLRGRPEGYRWHPGSNTPCDHPGDLAPMPSQPAVSSRIPRQRLLDLAGDLETSGRPYFPTGDLADRIRSILNLPGA